MLIFLLVVFAGFMIYVKSFSVLAIVAAAAFLFFVLENFESALLLLIFYLPFQIALNLAAGFDVASGRVLILLFLVIWFFRSLKNRKLEIDFSLETFLVILFLFFSTFSILQAFDTERALRKILVFYSVFPLFFVLTSFAGDKNFALKIAKNLVLAGCVLAVFGILQFLAQFVFGINPLFDFFAKIIAPVFYGNTFAAEVVANPSWLVNVGGETLLRAFAIFSDPHIFSFYLGLIIPIAFSLLFLAQDDFEKNITKSKKMFFVAFAALVLAELFTFSRGGYAGMAASFFILLILFRKYFTSKQKKIFAAIAVCGVIFFTFISSSVLTRFLSSFNLEEGSNVERIKNWQQGFNMFSDNCLWGVGIGNYSLFLDPTVAYRTPIYAHNLYLDLGAELGIFALISWLLLIVITIYELYIASKYTSDKLLACLALGLIGSLIWYSAHSFFDTSLYAPNILAMFVVILSLAVLVIRCAKMEKE